MSSNLKSIAFAAALCFVCSVLLTAASSGLQEFQEQNATIDRHANVLKSVGLITAEEKVAPEKIESMYERFILPLFVDASGQLVRQAQKEAGDLPLYLYVRQDKIEGYVIPIDSKGLWGRIYGYLALEDDGSTIAGFSVYKHSETPGLGGEIESRWFQENWVGKKIVNRAGDFVSVGIAKGDVDNFVAREKQVHYVDGISGATLTGKYLSEGIRDTLSSYEPVSIKFRKNLLDAPLENE
jgi:Na+-transporting NADH:ubiquinone oxidoreductase subunit C